ncbi:hypothetical protein ACTA71_012484 [Dictyostelium dimigraforme]
MNNLNKKVALPKKKENAFVILAKVQPIKNSVSPIKSPIKNAFPPNKSPFKIPLSPIKSPVKNVFSPNMSPFKIHRTFNTFINFNKMWKISFSRYPNRINKSHFFIEEWNPDYPQLIKGTPRLSNEPTMFSRYRYPNSGIFPSIVLMVDKNKLIMQRYNLNNDIITKLNSDKSDN